jgi:hypothetical protein
VANGKTEAQPLSKTERTALIRVVKSRFSLLRDGLHVRASEVMQAVEKQIELDHKEAVDEITKESDKIAAQINKLLKQMEEIERKAQSKGITCQWKILEYFKPPTWVPAHKGDLVRKKLEEIGGLNGRWEYELKRQEADLVEQLIIGDLTSDDSQKFLEKIPTAETLIPLPPGVKEIEVTR